MALWQVEFMMVPKDKIYDNKSISSIDSSNLWSGYEVNKDSIYELEKVLKRTKSWSDSIVQLGKISENVVEILYEGDMVEEVTCKLDLRNLNTNILDVILRFICINNLAIIANKKVYENPSRELLLKIIKESDAYKFIRNPQKFLEEI